MLVFSSQTSLNFLLNILPAYNVKMQNNHSGPVIITVRNVIVAEHLRCKLLYTSVNIRSVLKAKHFSNNSIIIANLYNLPIMV